jgi:hypothetical protein
MNGIGVVFGYKDNSWVRRSLQSAHDSERIDVLCIDNMRHASCADRSS